MRLFDSAKMYVLLFCVLALITMEKLRQITQSTVDVGTAGFDINKVMIGLFMIVMAVYLAMLFRKISNRIERTGILLTIVLCVLWLMSLLTQLGLAWAEIPHSRVLNASLHCMVTVLAGVRTFQVMGHRSPMDEA